MMKRRSIAPMLLGLALAGSLLAQEKAPPAAQAPRDPEAPGPAGGGCGLPGLKEPNIR